MMKSISCILLVCLLGLMAYAEETQEQKVERLIRELQNEDSNVRSNAAFALSAIGEGAVDAVPALRQLLQDKSAKRFVLVNVVLALSSIGEGAKDAVPALRQLLQNKDAYVRRIAREALGEIGSVDAVSAPIQASKKSNSASKKLTVDDIFPTDWVLDVQITLDPKDWDTIRYQSRNFFEALQESRQYAPLDHPYTYVEASVSIDGVEFPQVGIRKKGFLGSQNSTRPSLKIKLNHVDKEGQIEGLTNLTFNNNQQDVSLISQFMGYGLFNAAGSPAPRCAYAKLTVNGQSLGVYTHVERIHRPLLKRAFGNDNGVLYESTAVDFNPDWAGGFEHKLGPDEVGRKKIQQLIDVLDSPDEGIELAIGELVDLDSFYTFWVVEGLLSFWDGYSGNRNNFFFYLNPETDKFHFIPWGADSLFERYSPIRDDRRDPASVKIQGLIAYRLYQLESGRQRYEQTLRNIIESHWDEAVLLAETERIEVLVEPFFNLGAGYRFAASLEERRQFIRQRRGEIIAEIVNGMPKWETRPADPAVMPSGEFDGFEPQADSIWSAAAEGDLKAVKEHLAQGVDINAKEDKLDITALSLAALYDHAEIVAFLVQKGADVNARGDDGGTALHAAAFLGQYEVAKLLVQKGADVNAKKEDGETPISSTMADWGTTEFIAGILQLKLDREKVEAGRAKIAKLLRQQGAQTDFAGPVGNDIWTAAGAGNIEAVKQHLAKGVDVDAKNKDEATALHVAAFLGQYEVAELLIQKGADVNVSDDDGGTALHAAAFLGQYEVAKLLVQKGADVNARKNDGATAMDVLKVDWDTTLFIARLLQIQVDREKVEAGRAQIVELLRQHGAQTDFAGPVDNDIWTAAGAGNLEAVKQHLAKGVDVDAKNKDEATALHVAAFLGQYEVAELLIQKGADVNVRGGKGETPIDSLKVDWGITEFVASLLQLKLDREKVEAGRAKIAKLLRQHGAK